MKVLDKITLFLTSQEQEHFYKYIGGYFLGVFILCVAILGYYYKTTSNLKSTLSSLYKTQQDSKKLLEKVKIVEKQKDAVDALLDAEKSFKIKNYFDELLRNLNLVNNQKKTDVTAEEIIKNEYSEIKLVSQLQGISMKQLCQLLELLEKKQRIYTKELTITKGRGPTIDVNLTIGTLTQAASKE